MANALTRPNLIARAVSLAAVACAVVVVILLTQSGASYTLRMQMTNANGIRPGSQVLLGGVPVGKVKSINLGPHDVVIATLTVDPSKVHVGQGARASIIAANLLGEKYVALSPGNPNAALPSRTLLPPSSITVPTDLDQIVDVFDGTTRDRLAILINEMGIAVAGRQSDVSAILRQLPLSTEAATRLLTQLVQDNHTLRDVVANSNQFIVRIYAQRPDLGRAIDAASGAATTVARQADNLRQTIVRAPQALRTLRSFVIKLGDTAGDLTPAAAQIAASAAPLDGLLGQIRPFEQAAVPALNRATAVSPLLTRLSDQGTPIVRLAVPTVQSLARIAKLASPLTYWTGLSISDLVGLLNGWDRAIQFRDGLGHVFHAQIAISPDLIANLAQLGLPTAARRRTRPPRSRPTGAAAVRPGSSAPSGASTTPSRPSSPVAGLLGTLSGALHGVTGSVNGTTAALNGATGALNGGQRGNPQSSLSSLLDYLLK